VAFFRFIPRFPTTFAVAATLFASSNSSNDIGIKKIPCATGSLQQGHFLIGIEPWTRGVHRYNLTTCEKGELEARVQAKHELTA
jgi:hypothetical protein